MVRSSQERRGSLRVSGEFTIWYRWQGQPFRRSSATNLSEDGVRFVSHEPIPPGTEVHLSLKAGDRYVSAVADPVWQERGQGWRSRIVGATLQACTSSDRHALRQLVTA